MRQLSVWVWRAWPVLLVLAILGVHQLVLARTNLGKGEINALVSLVLQLVGGLLVLYSIDSNIGIIRKKSLVSELKQYLREFPLLKRSYVLQVQGAAHVHIGARARLSGTRNPTSLEERVAYIQEQLDAFRRDHQEDLREIRDSLEKKAKDLGDRLDALSRVVRDIESKFDQVAVGDVRIQVLGVMLIIYGAISGYVA